MKMEKTLLFMISFSVNQRKSVSKNEDLKNKPNLFVLSAAYRVQRNGIEKTNPIYYVSN